MTTSNKTQADKPSEVFTEIVQTRRSIRKFTDKPVPMEVLDHCLDLALLSPNSSNLQPWQFVVIENADVRQQLIPACMNQNAVKTCSRLVAVLGHRHSWKENAQLILDSYQGKAPPIVEKYYGNKIHAMYEPGTLGLKGKANKMLFNVKGLREPVAREPFTHAEQKTWITKTCSLAAQTFMLAVRAHGFDTCPLEGFDSKRVGKLLGLSKDEWIVMLVAVGERDEKGLYGERFRVPRDKVVRYLK